MIRPFAVAAACLVLLVPVAQAGASDDGDVSDETRRLRACLTSGIGGAPRDSLSSSVVAVRALCGNQINALRRANHREIERTHPVRSAADAAVVEDLKSQADRRLNTEIARLVARLTGLDG